MSTLSAPVRRGIVLESITLAWNVVGVIVLSVTALAARSVALGGFGVDSLIEILASTVVIWELRDVKGTRQRRALLYIGAAFIACTAYVVIITVLALVHGVHPEHSPGGIVWTALTAVAMFALAAAKARLGQRIGNPVLITEGRVTLVDGLLASAVLVGLSANALAGWWWADPGAGLVIVYYAVRESREAFAHYRAAV